jgi:hypothetical protein
MHRVTEPVQLELHAFSDASENGFGACVYLRFIFERRCQCRLSDWKGKSGTVKTVINPATRIPRNCFSRLTRQHSPTRN